jgi:hypothetical protein
MGGREMNRIVRTRLSIIAVLLIAPMTLVGCTEEMIDEFCDFYCAMICIPDCLIGLISGDIRFCSLCIFGCHDWGYCPLESLQGCIDNPDECTTMFELYQTAMETCEAYPEECAMVLDSYAQSLDTDAKE